MAPLAVFPGGRALEGLLSGAREPTGAVPSAQEAPNRCGSLRSWPQSRQPEGRTPSLGGTRDSHVVHATAGQHPAGRAAGAAGLGAAHGGVQRPRRLLPLRHPLTRPGPRWGRVLDVIQLREGLKHWSSTFGLHSERAIDQRNGAVEVWRDVGWKVKPNLPFLELLSKARVVRGDSLP